jgi:hypothetical protein
MEILFIFLGVIGFVLFILFYSSFSWGFVAMKFYHWFVLTSFPKLPEFTITQFIGFILFTHIFFTNSSSTSIKDEYKDKSTEWVGTFIKPWVTLVFGWLIYSFLF